MRKQLARCLCAVMAVVMLSSGCTIKKSSEAKYGAVMETEKLAEKIKEKYAEDEKYEYTEPLKDLSLIHIYKSNAVRSGGTGFSGEQCVLEGVRRHSGRSGKSGK